MYAIRSYYEDLEKLEEEGLIIREHGGAYLKDIGINVRNIELLSKEHMRNNFV